MIILNLKNFDFSQLFEIYGKRIKKIKVFELGELFYAKEHLKKFTLQTLIKIRK